jgi:DNA-binding NtrC family response regulator
MCLVAITEQLKSKCPDSINNIEVHAVRTLAAGLSVCEEERAEAVLVEVPLAGCSPEEVLSALKADWSHLPVLFIGQEWDMADVVRLVQLGAFQVLSSDSTPEEVQHWIRRACEVSAAYERDEHSNELKPWKQFLVGESWSMRVLGEVIRLVAPRRCTVLITGETGTGKEMAARALHACSPRSNQPTVSINCSALPTELLEAELFGYSKGAFTGAYASRIGRIERANRGTLFLDEIGDLPMNLQAKLLRVIQEREVQPLGTSDTVRVDIRVVAATNSNLEELVRKGKFREDLYYRLNVAPLHLPPLRQRRSDIPLLTSHFTRKICELEGLPEKGVTAEALAWLTDHDWPGNVRQLENAVETAIALSGERDVLMLSDFGPVMCGAGEIGMFAVPSEGFNYNSVVDQFERNILERALQLAGSKKKAAELLQLKRTTFSAKLKSLNIENPAMEYEDESEPLAMAHAV